jgi:hypothetical protein
VAHSTIIRGAKDLLTAPAAAGRVRRRGGGRPALSQSNPALLKDLRQLVEPATMGDPMRPLLWVSKSREKLASVLHGLNHAVSANTVGKMLMTLGYSRQVNRKTKEGSHHPDRDGQFQHINGQVLAVQAADQPVISVDTKKKELIGEYKNGGSDYRAAGCPDPVKVHDFVDKSLGKVAPYGIYDVATNTGWVSLGIDHDTAEFAVNAVRRWHQAVGSVRYPKADRVLITADGGGSNGSRVRLWKPELQKLADETGLTFQVCHYPPGTSKWNKIGRGSESAVFGSQRSHGSPVHEGRIRFEGGSVGRRPTSPGQARRGWIGPRPSSVNQCGWPWPVINSRGLLPLRSARRLRMKRRWFKKNRSKTKYEPPRWRRSVK